MPVGKGEPYVLLASGDACNIVALPDVNAAIERLDDQRRRRLRFIMEKATEFGPRNMPPDQFKSEGRFPIGDRQGTQVMVFAFKVWQFRVYAAEKHIGGKRTFVCTEVDVAKKKDRADRALLGKAATNFRPIFEMK